MSINDTTKVLQDPSSRALGSGTSSEFVALSSSAAPSICSNFTWQDDCITDIGKAVRAHCFYHCQTCLLFLRETYLRGNSDTNRRWACYHRLSYKRYGHREPLLQKPIGIENVKRGVARRKPVCTFSRVRTGRDAESVLP